MGISSVPTKETHHIYVQHCEADGRRVFGFNMGYDVDTSHRRYPLTLSPKSNTIGRGRRESKLIERQVPLSFLKLLRMSFHSVKN